MQFHTTLEDPQPNYMILEVLWDGLWTLSFGLPQFHGHSSWLMCEVIMSFYDKWMRGTLVYNNSFSRGKRFMHYRRHVFQGLIQIELISSAQRKRVTIGEMLLPKPMWYGVFGWELDDAYLWSYQLPSLWFHLQNYLQKLFSSM